MNGNSKPAPHENLTVGYFPSHFPRDPIVVNTFLEQLALGQVLQPLVRIADSGDVRPGLAESWMISKGGQRIELMITPSIRFSNGKRVQAKDVAYTLRRHLQSTTSQSKFFLQDIDTIEIINEQYLTVNLKRPNNSLLQAFSRDQLGILPDGWQFKPESDEPLIGSGPYRLVRREESWHFIWNENYPEDRGNRVAEWKVLQSSDLSEPAYLPFVLQAEVKTIATKLSLKKRGFKPQTSYVQCSYWWFEANGESIDDHERLKIMSTVDDLVGRSIHRLGAEAATGLVPCGIPGSLKDRPTIENEPKEDNVTSSPIRIAIPGHMLAEHRDFDDVEATAKKTGYQIEFHTYDLAKFEQEMVRIKPHVLALRFAGAFKDPVGFIGIAGKLLGRPLDEYAKVKDIRFQDILESTSTNAKLTKVKAYGQALIRQGYCVPGWKTPIYSYLADGFDNHQSANRFIPSLEDVSLDLSADRAEPS